MECDTLNDFNEKFRLYSEGKAKIKMVRELYEELLGQDDYQELKREADNQRKFVIESDNVEPGNIERKLDSLTNEKEKISGRILELKQLKIDGGLEIPLIDIENNIKFMMNKLLKRKRNIHHTKRRRRDLSRRMQKLSRITLRC